MSRLNGVQRRFAIGSVTLYPKVDQARERARDLLQAVARGEDPTRKVNPQATPRVETVTAVCGSFIERYAKPKNRSWRTTEALLANHLLPTLGARDVRDVSRADIRDLLDRLADNGMGAGVNRVLAAIRKVFGWAVERDYLEKSPVDGIKPPADEIDRDRWLTDAEIQHVWRAAERLVTLQRGFVHTLILTGQRRSEVAAMRWDELDLASGVWTLPREKAKNDEEHDIPLNPQALAVLAGLPRIGPFVFSGSQSHQHGQAADVPFAGFSKLKSTLDRAITRLVQDGGLNPMRPWRLHDLRRTCGTHMSKLGVTSETISRVMNHAEGGVTKRYVRHSFLDQKRRALDIWGAKVESLVGPMHGGARERKAGTPTAEQATSV